MSKCGQEHIFRTSKGEQMLITLKSATGGRCAGTMFLVAAWALIWPQNAPADNPHAITVMTRNMDAGTDLNYILARASRLADEIATHKPDLIALQEVTLWRTGPLLQPPATEVLYDQLDLL